MKRLFGIKIWCISIAFLLFFSVGISFTRDKNVVMNLLVVGLDDACENTDVISVLRLDSERKSIKILQIPRDTFCDIDVYGKKINHIYSTARFRGFDKGESVNKLREFLSEQLSIELDGHIMLSGSDFIKLVDAIGGVYIDLNEDLTLYNETEPVLHLKKGRNRLDAESAMLFIRHRKGYLMGDLDRLRMQRIFIEGLYKTLISSLNVKNFIKVMSVFQQLDTDIPLATAVSLLSSRNLYKGVSPEIFTLKGEGIKGQNGTWYYAINRYSNEQLCSQIFGIEPEKFDAKKLFLNSREKSFEQIYFKKQY